MNGFSLISSAHAETLPPIVINAGDINWWIPAGVAIALVAALIGWEWWKHNHPAVTTVVATTAESDAKATISALTTLLGKAHDTIHAMATKQPAPASGADAYRAAVAAGTLQPAKPAAAPPAPISYKL